MVPDKPQEVEKFISHGVVILASEPDTMLSSLGTITFCELWFFNATMSIFDNLEFLITKAFTMLLTRYLY